MLVKGQRVRQIVRNKLTFKPIKAIKFIILFASLFSFHSCIAQQRQNDKTKLQQFFQQNADSTIILGFDKVLLEPAKYLILSKHADTISAFYYGMVGETLETFR